MSIFKNLISVVPLCQYDKITLLSACAFYLPRNFVRQSASNRTKVSPRRVKRDTYEFQVRASLPAHLSDSPVFEAIVSSILEHASYRSRKYLISEKGFHENPYLRLLDETIRLRPKLGRRAGVREASK